MARSVWKGPFVEQSLIKKVENIKNDLSDSFNSKIKLTYKNDKSLVGGLILQVGSTMIDTSIKNKLQKIEKEMLGA